MKIMTTATILIIAIMLLTACGKPEVRYVVNTVEVKVPVIQKAVAPQELYRAKLLPGEVPVAISPSDPAAVIAFDAVNQKKLNRILQRNESLLDGWEAYGN